MCPKWSQKWIQKCIKNGSKMEPPGRGGAKQQGGVLSSGGCAKGDFRGAKGAFWGAKGARGGAKGDFWDGSPLGAHPPETEKSLEKEYSEYSESDIGVGTRLRGIRGVPKKSSAPTFSMVSPRGVLRKFSSVFVGTPLQA